jgi:hypothetical protein
MQEATDPVGAEDRPVLVEGNAGDFSVDAALVGELLDLAASDVLALMRDGKITSRCERGEGEHAGQYRLTFFHEGRRARLNVDAAGRIIKRSIIDYGEHPLPPALRRAGDGESR